MSSGKPTYKELEFRLASMTGQIETLMNEAAMRIMAERELKNRTHELGERVKELDCLYAVNRLADKSASSVDEMLEGAVKLIPPAWQYPEITCARIVYEDREFKSAGFCATDWVQTSDIVFAGRAVGTVEVYYLEACPEIDEGPFMKEERSLIDAIAEHLGLMIEKQSGEVALRESEEIHRVTLSNISDAVFITKHSGSFTYICPNVHLIFGFTGAEVRAMGKIDRLIGGGLFEPEELDKLGEIPNVERVVKSKDGAEHSLLINIKKVSIKDGSVLYTCRDATERKRAEDALRKSEKQLRALSQKIITTQEEERSTLSRELHDELGHELATLRLELDWLKKHSLSDINEGHIDALTDMVLGTTAKLRGICKGLRPVITDYPGLGLAMETLAREFGSRAGFEVDISIDNIDENSFDPAVAINVYRVLQEALTNAARHSGAGLVSVEFGVSGGELFLEVSDDGKGYCLEAAGCDGLGIIGMRERTSICGGILVLDSEPGGGARLVMKIPLHGKV